jgi:hypothetical protein
MHAPFHHRRRYFGDPRHPALHVDCAGSHPVTSWECVHSSCLHARHRRGAVQSVFVAGGSTSSPASPSGLGSLAFSTIGVAHSPHTVPALALRARSSDACSLSARFEIDAPQDRLGREGGSVVGPGGPPGVKGSGICTYRPSPCLGEERDAKGRYTPVCWLGVWMKASLLRLDVGRGRGAPSRARM